MKHHLTDIKRRRAYPEGYAPNHLAVLSPSFLNHPFWTAQKASAQRGFSGNASQRLCFSARVEQIVLAVLPSSSARSSAVMLLQSAAKSCLKVFSSRRAKASAMTTSLGTRFLGLLKHFNLRLENTSPSSSPNCAIPYSTMASLMNWFVVPLRRFLHSSSTAQAAWE